MPVGVSVGRDPVHGRGFGHGAVFHHYNKWRKARERKELWMKLRDKHRNEFDMSSVDPEEAMPLPYEAERNANTNAGRNARRQMSYI